MSIAKNTFRKYMYSEILVHMKYFYYFRF